MITGPNGTGKTSVLEAIVYLGTRRSFRGAPAEALVRTGADRRHRAGRGAGDDAAPTLVEAEIAPAGRSRTRVNRKTVSAPQGPGRGHAVHHLLPRGPGHRRRRPQGPAGPARRRAGPARRRGGPGGRRDRAGAAPAGRAAAPGRAGGSATRWPTHARRVGPAPGRRRQGARGGPGAPGGRPRAAGGGEPTTAWPAWTERRRWCARHYQRSWDGRPARGAGGQPDRRSAARGQHGRPAPRRPASCCSRAARPARTPHRASSAAWRWPCAWPSTSWSRTVPTCARPCSSTTSSPSSTRCGAGRWWPSSDGPVDPHHGGAPARGDRRGRGGPGRPDLVPVTAPATATGPRRG